MNMMKINNDNFTGVRLLVRAETKTYGYIVVEMNKEGRLYNNHVKSSETGIRVKKGIVGEVVISGIRIKSIKDSDFRPMQEIWAEQFNS
jgi:hypothetical protein